MADFICSDINPKQIFQWCYKLYEVIYGFPWHKLSVFLSEISQAKRQKSRAALKKELEWNVVEGEYLRNRNTRCWKTTKE